MEIDWQHVLNSHGPTVWKTLRSLLGNDADARDCYQNVFLEALQFSRKVEVDDWNHLLGRIARVRALDVLRIRYRRAERVDGTASVDTAECRSATASDELDAKELSDRLRHALSAISIEQAEVFVMRYVDQLTYDEIAQRTQRNTQGTRGRELQRLRSERVERTFAHLCDTGGARRTWLRGIEDVRKRYMSAAIAFNLGRIMRLLIGAGKPRYAVLLAELAALAFCGCYGIWKDLLISFHDFTRRSTACLQSIGEYPLAPNQLKFKWARLA